MFFPTLDWIVVSPDVTSFLAETSEVTGMEMRVHEYDINVCSRVQPLQLQMRRRTTVRKVRDQRQMNSLRENEECLELPPCSSYPEVVSCHPHVMSCLVFTAAMFVYGGDNRCRLFLYFLSLWTPLI